MKNTEWTPEPWKASKNHISSNVETIHIGTCYGSGTSKIEDNANAARIVNCVNALKGKPYPILFRISFHRKHG